jgi:cytochrome c-type biogenesis protein CcmH
VRRTAAVVLCAAAVALLAAAPAPAAQATWSVQDLEGQLMCPVCNTLLNNSQSAAANRIRQQIEEKHSQGWSEERVRNYLIAQYGEEILASPPKHGFDLLAWLVPAAVLLGGGAVAVVLAMSWSRSRSGRGGPPAPPPGVDSDMDARIDAELAREEA